jgi:methylamine dehydrogenase light chain
MTNRKHLDGWFEDVTRTMARQTSRRGFLARLGMVVTGTAVLPLLPVRRGSQAAAAEPGHGKATDDPNACEYWKYCAIDGFLCSCCGGTSSSCPPGTTPSPITWIGTCQNPADGRDYMVSYNDCCGKTSCGNCFCNRNEREKPLYRLSLNNDANWCMANDNPNYHCSVSVILGVAQK